jgi:hypothetical protein
VIKRPERTASGVAKRFGLLALIATVLVALLGFLAPTASASPTFHPQTRVAAIEQPTGQLVAPHSLVLAVQGRERAPNYDRSATGSSVAAEGDTVSVFHGSLDEATSIQANGLATDQGTTFVSRDIAAAQDAIGPSRIGYPGSDPGIIESQVPRSVFEENLLPNERPYQGFYPYPLDSTEIPLRTPEQIQIFNDYIVGR